MHTFTEAIAISFGLVSVLSAGKSISTVAEHREPKEKERKIVRKREWLVSRKSFRAKITRRYKFTVKTKSFWHVLVPPLSLLDVYRCGSQSR